jgi:hypothetical protein
MVEQHEPDEESGLDREKILAAERDALEGNYMTGDEFFSSLRASRDREDTRQARAHRPAAKPVSAQADSVQS